MCSIVCVCVRVCLHAENVTAGISPSPPLTTNPPRGSSLITQRSQPTPGHFLSDLPQESRACWAVDCTCWSQTIPLPVPVLGQRQHRERHIYGERQSPGFYLPLAVRTSCSLTLPLGLSVLFISLLTIHPGPAGPVPVPGTKYTLVILFQISSHAALDKDMSHMGLFSSDPHYIKLAADVD